MNDIDQIILTDCDGVLLNWEHAFNVWVQQRGYKRVVTETNKFEYGVQHQYNISREEKQELVLQFNNSAAIGFLPPLRDAIEYVTRLHREHGFMFINVTSLSTDRSAQRLRIANLEKVFGTTLFEDHVFLDTGADKDDVLKRWEGSGLFWVEDKLENAVAGKRVGLEPLLMEHGHNMIRSNKPRTDPVWVEGADIPRFEMWKDVYKHITGV